ncbi:amidohydrolase [Parenemella sanctibonifatiensis]|uniref:Amidohydrolase n=2 Tax=Parenemella sanctibonifatiensis TaxID=2016505 RepID=A0A255E4H9_9ACTN|nr:amidohydrolase [Parenemella sanctibonifatiensis]
MRRTAGAYDMAPVPDRTQMGGSVGQDCRMHTDPTPQILHGGQVRSQQYPGATAVAVQHGRIVAIGTDDDAASWSGKRIDLRGAWLTPAFVDAHVHACTAGEAMTSLDLAAMPSAAVLLDIIARTAQRHPGVLLTGQGWDDSAWPDGRPTRAALDRAAPATMVLLERTDCHSAVVSTALARRVPGLRELDGWHEDGFVLRDAHDACRQVLSSLYSASERLGHARTALRTALQYGIGTVHECGTPQLGPLGDLALVGQAGEELGVDVIRYWGADADADSLALVHQLGLAGLAGDLDIDGTMGSRTAWLRDPYADASHRGTRYRDLPEAAAHVIACTRAGIQAGFHCIGDAGIDIAVGAIRAAVEACGVEAVRACRHRLEHVEMIDFELAADLADWGVYAVVQPLFDHAWGAPGRLYEQRLGERYTQMNPFSGLADAGVRLALSSDAPVTPFSSWSMVAAAVHTAVPGHGLSVATAVDAATRQGYRAGGDDASGVIEVGAPATLAAWDLPVPTPLDADGLPRLDPDDPLPACVATMVRGRLAYTLDPWLAGDVGPGEFAAP